MHTRRSFRQAALAVLLAVGLIATGATPVSAALAVVTPQTVAADVTATFGPTGSTQLSLGDLVLVPDTGSVAPVTEDGLVVWSNTQDGVSHAARATPEGGTQQFVDIARREATESFEYYLKPGFTAKAGPAGSVQIYIGDKLFGAIPAPVAKDAHQADIPVRYEVSADGTKIVEVVSHRQSYTVYPVVADPWFAIHRDSLDLLLNRSETNHLMYGYTLGAAIGGVLPWPFGAIATAVYGSIAGYANWVYNRGGCIRVIINKNWSVWYGSYFGGYCR